MVKKRYNPKYQDAGRREKDPLYRYYMSPSVLEAVRDELLDEVIVKRRYLEAGLRATDVARTIGRDKRIVSAAMTTHFHTCFRDWINKYRCDYAMTLLRDRRRPDMSITDISRMCGFSTIQAFYKAFYRHTGVPPAQYRKAEL